MKKDFFLVKVCLILSISGLVNRGFSQINFVNQAVDLGLIFSSGDTQHGNGVSFFDFDNDGWDDLTFTTDENQQIRFFKNVNGTFVEQFFSIPNLSYETKSVTWVDFDNDGDKDMFVTSFTSGNKLLRNDGDNVFIDITSSTGLPEINIYTYGASWGDIDNDGYLDVFLSSFDPTKQVPNYLYKNDGDGTFTNISSSAGISQVGHLSFCSAFFDYNNDGWQDIYVSNDRVFNKNILYENNGNGTFTDVSVVSGTDTDIDAMTVTIDDFNSDGWFDIYVSGSPDDGNAFFKNNGDNTFTDISVNAGTLVYGFCWGAVFLDSDNDMDLDLYVTSSLDGSSVYNSSLFFENQGNENFVNSSSYGFLDDTKESHSNAIGDIDNDGLLDIIVTNRDNKNVDLWKNSTNTTNNWLKIKLQGVESNIDGIGSVIEISTAGEVQYRYTLCGEGYLSQNSASEIFGIGNNTSVDYVKVKWLSGVEDYFYDIDANQHLTLIEGTGETNTQIFGCTDPDSCNFDPNATIDDGSCIILDNILVTGNLDSNPLKVETYSISSPEKDAIYRWSVINGHIIEGEDSNTIRVRWDIASSGVISVINESSNCSVEASVIEINLSLPSVNNSNYSIARLWNEVLLHAIRNDYARPTVHARNLFHASMAMYDAWAIHDDNSEPYFVGNKLNGFTCAFDENYTSKVVGDNKEKVEETLSYALYTLLKFRFQNSPNKETTIEMFDNLMYLLDYDLEFNSIDYSNGNPAALGNYIGSKIIEYGMQDGANEIGSYENQYYQPANDPLLPILPGNESITDPNRWQPLSLEVYIDQSGNVVSTDNSVPEFLSPEWGNTYSFALSEDSQSIFSRNSNTYSVYHDPGAPPFIGLGDDQSSDIYKWGFSLVSVWGSHLSPNDGVLWDISPKSLGNISSDSFPENFSSYDSFYDLIYGGDISIGRSMNPITNELYESQLVPRGDYTRVLAEFWADGPDSETPPGHWFTILNYVNDQPNFSKKFEGTGPVLDDLEWEVKSYFSLGGAMHDAAIAAWSIKGWYDYIRPISAIRYMSEKGQSTDMSLENYHEEGIPLIDGYIEVVGENDDLVGDVRENLGKIKLYTWKGHDYIENTDTDIADVGWILAENWWPYQRPSFVTPPFAGYVSGHSTYSRAAAEVLTKITGSEYFPGGMGEFVAKKNEFLVFEEGPSQDIILQWATYRDASDQCSLSRIWGGIHPPMDDIPGRLIGEQVGVDAFKLAKSYFSSSAKEVGSIKLFPNPINSDHRIILTNSKPNITLKLFDINGRNIPIKYNFKEQNSQTHIEFNSALKSGIYILKSDNQIWKLVIN